MRFNNTQTQTQTGNKAMNVAQAIVDQLGGIGRLKAMVGASNFQAEENKMRFRVKGSRKMNMLEIELNATDTYTVRFQKYSPSKFTVKTISELEGVYNDMLKSLFESNTGLYLSL